MGGSWERVKLALVQGLVDKGGWMQGVVDARGGR